MSGTQPAWMSDPVVSATPAGGGSWQFDPVVSGPPNDGREYANTGWTGTSLPELGGRIADVGRGAQTLANMSTEDAQRALQPEPGRAFGGALPLSYGVDDQGNPIPGTGKFDIRGGVIGDLIRGVVGGQALLDKPFVPPTASSDEPVQGALTVAPSETTMALLGAPGLANRIVPGAARALSGLVERSPQANELLPARPSVSPLGDRPIASSTPASVEAPSVAPGMGAVAPEPAPTSVGAAGTPYSVAAPSVREQMVQQRHGERLAFQETPKPGDATEYVPGVQPTRAEITLDPMHARQEKQIRMENPAPFVERDAANNEAYRNFYADHAGTEVTLDRLRQTRSDQAKADIEAVFGKPGELRPGIDAADATPVIEHAKQILATEDGKRPEVRAYIEKAIKELYDSEGNLESDPKLLYGARKNLETLLSAQQRKIDPLVERVEPLLKDLRDTLDSVIEGAAPGYRQYMRNYAENSRPIDKQELLQKYQTKIETGPDRVIRFGEVDRMVRDLLAQRAARGNTQAKSLTEDDMAALLALRQSLARSNQAERLARAKGSDTAQILQDRAAQFVKSPAAMHIAGQVAGTLLGGPGLGNLAAMPLVHFGRQIYTAGQTKNALFPDLSKVPGRFDRNSLQP